MFAASLVAGETWLIFIAAACVVLLVPGPTALLLLCRSLSHGGRATIPLVIGVVAGDLVAMTLSMLGLGAMLLTSATLFTACKWLGALYIVYLGIKTWRAPALALTAAPPVAGFMREAFVVTALNPKAILFFVAFLPQFVDTAKNGWPQLLIFGATYLALAAVNATLYSVFSVKIRAQVLTPARQKILQRASGGALICAGAAAALARPIN